METEPKCNVDKYGTKRWFLNGVWTAACVAETERQRKLDDAKTK